MILEAIQQANTDAGIPNLSFASLQEFNSFQDSFNFNDYPRNIVVPPRITGVFNGIRAAELLIIEGWVLTRINDDTNDWRSVEIYPDYIEPMSTLARKFVRNLLNADIIDPQRDPANYSITPEWMFLSAHLFGVSYQVQLPIMKNVC